jgi:hypothetical protein
LVGGRLPCQLVCRFYRFFVACRTLRRKLRIHLRAFGLCFCFVCRALGGKLSI